MEKKDCRGKESPDRLGTRIRYHRFPKKNNTEFMSYIIGNEYDEKAANL